MTEYANHTMEATMSRILEIRYTDLAEEKKLCQELLAWALENCDIYAQAFALTYLGDYFIAIYEEENAGKYLLEAEKLLSEHPSYEAILFRLYSLLGIYHDMRSDEQAGIDYYLRAIVLAEKLQDVEGECMVLNNLAFAFQRFGCYEEALQYYLRAYRLQASIPQHPTHTTLLSNLAEVSWILHRFDDAKGYIEECERKEEDPRQRELFGYKNWCGYYSAIGNREEARKYAALVLQNADEISEDRLTAFEVYLGLCKNMMALGEGAYAGRFLQAMENVSEGGGLDRIKAFEETKIRYTILFEPPEKHAEAYRRFFQKNQQFREKVTESIVDAMKSKIYLDQLMQQAERMHTEQETLEHEVNMDELTGLYNRKFLETTIRDCSENHSAEALGVIFLDIDYFKEYNDFYGHIQGDGALQEIASCLMSCRQKNIYPCRYGGDEFVCICRRVDVPAMEAYIQSVRSCLDEKALPHEKSLCGNKVTLSIGYAAREENNPVEVHLLFQMADQALYQSKRSGRNTYTRKQVDAL